MSNKIYAFILSSIAGVSTLIGFLFIYLKKNRGDVISSALGFASGVMLTISLFDLIPNSLTLMINKYSFFYSLFILCISIIVGIFISFLLDKKINKSIINNKNELYKLGILSMLVIVLHNIPEGIVTYITTTNNIKLGLSLAIAIALHNIPEGISISIPIYYSTNNKIKAFTYTLISGISEPIGAFISYLFLSKFINDSILSVIYSIIGGMMIYISYNELYKESIEYNKHNAHIFFIFGVFIMLLSHILIT